MADTEINKSELDALKRDQLKTGMFFASRFRIDKSLGQGAMGKVYLVSDMMLGGQQVALKILNSSVESEDTHLARFLREVQLTRTVTHPAVVRTFDIGNFDGVHYFTMEYVEGKTLGQMIRGQPCDPNKVVDILSQLCEGLLAIHASGIIHRDLKSANVMLTNDGKVKIADFGVARPNASSLTGQDELVGSATHMAPEVWKQSEISALSDLYSLGVIAYELLTGVLPFDGNTAYELMWKHLKEPPVNPSELHAAVPSWLAEITLKLLSKEPAGRFQSAEQVLLMLKQGPKTEESRSVPGTEYKPGNPIFTADIWTPVEDLAPPPLLSNNRGAAKYGFQTEPKGIDEKLKRESAPREETPAPVQKPEGIRIECVKRVLASVSISALLAALALALGRYLIPIPWPSDKLLLLREGCNYFASAIALAALLLIPFLIVCAVTYDLATGLKSYMKLVCISLALYLLLFGSYLFNISGTSRSDSSIAKYREALSAAEVSLVNLSEVLLLQLSPKGFVPVPAADEQNYVFQETGSVSKLQKFTHLTALFIFLLLICAIGCKISERHRNNFRFHFLLIPFAIAVLSDWGIRAVLSQNPSGRFSTSWELELGEHSVLITFSSLVAAALIWASILLCSCLSSDCHGKKSGPVIKSVGNGKRRKN